jgi:hypothetical protein
MSRACSTHRKDRNHILVGEPGVKVPDEISRYTLENNIKIILLKLEWEDVRLNFTGSSLGLVVGLLWA